GARTGAGTASTSTTTGKLLGIVALCLSAVLSGATGAAADPDATPPPRTNGTTEKVYMVKGYDPPTRGTKPGVSCTSRWNTAEKAMKRWGWRGKFVQVKFYNGDTRCDLSLSIMSSRARTLGDGEEDGTVARSTALEGRSYRLQ
ncbi:hypothetical protein ACFQ7F_39420, partial [Streptomyces sp. NPDC056486]